MTRRGDKIMGKGYSEKLSRPAYENLGELENLEPLFPEGTEESLENWNLLRGKLLGRWKKILGSPSFSDFSKEVEQVDAFEEPDFYGKVYRQPTGPVTKQLLLLMEPKNAPVSPRPGAIVPYYHPDEMAGYNLKEHKLILERKNVQFGLHLVRQGYVVVCHEAFPYNTVPDPESNEGFAWWKAASKKLLEDNPGWTGIGKLIWDTRLATDFLLNRNDIDKEHIVIIGHSLGGKMAFCTGCLDTRIKAIIASDFGIGWKFTNWDTEWYYGKQIYEKGFTLAHHQLLALHAPRSFLLIGGFADRPASWQYINEAKKVYRLYGRENAAGFFDHASGHQPTEESVRTAYKWLAEQFGLPEKKWEF